MSTETLKDRTSKPLGTIRGIGDGRLEGRLTSGSLVGTYCPKSNQTRDRSGGLVGTGNMLAYLIMKEYQK
jgi:hypothetical protein